MVNFSKPTTFLGRNGVFKVIGITLAKVTGGYDHKTPVIVIEPLTSRGLSGRCNIEIPVGDIPALITELQKFTPQVCKQCGSPLEHDRCTDETCPYSDHEQDWDYDVGWILKGKTMKPSVKLRRYPKKVVIAHARKMNTKANARKMAWLDSGPYKVSKGN